MFVLRKGCDFLLIQVAKSQTVLIAQHGPSSAAIAPLVERHCGAGAPPALILIKA
jgi:hypothetical protein